MGTERGTEVEEGLKKEEVPDGGAAGGASWEIPGTYSGSTLDCCG